MRPSALIDPGLHEVVAGMKTTGATIQQPKNDDSSTIEIEGTHSGVAKDKA